MNEVDGQESKTKGIWGAEAHQSLRIDACGSENAERVSKGAGNQPVALDRKSSKEGIDLKNPVGGILDQLLEDAEKQLVKTRECIVWYREKVD